MSSVDGLTSRATAITVPLSHRSRCGLSTATCAMVRRCSGTPCTAPPTVPTPNERFRLFFGDAVGELKSLWLDAFPAVKEHRALFMQRETARALNIELARARAKFLGTRFLVAALAEELGELADAHDAYGPKDARTIKEALQCACVAVRLAEEGDAASYDREGFLGLASAFGRVARGLLQRQPKAVDEALDDLKDLARWIQVEDDDTFSNVTDAEAKP